MRTLLLAALLPLAACSVHSDAESNGVTGTGSPTSRNYAIADFSDVEQLGSDDVDVRVGSAFTVRAEGPAKQLDQLVIEKVGGALRIGRKNASGFSWGGGDHGMVKVFVTMPRIAKVSVAGSGNMAIDTVQGGSFEAASAGSGDMKIGLLAVDSADLSLAGSGGIEAAGTAKRLTVQIAGSGDIDAKKLKANSAEVSIAGSGGITADVTGPAKISMIGSGDVDVGKGAQCTITKVGSGEVTCG